ncbi:hypothetical protein SKAU_G00299210 [Synaphobranchus kaupii]|uniref:SAP domain-containing protein n=1 Tax=Synaphobranchus kaupii TaxID=118154 RepID=A0A9Q1EVE2_SYNKA|nr:hypothetical protein SKAU_G00299210 [Synaphobranchus kaupii]
MDSQTGEEPRPGGTASGGAAASSPQSEAVTSELQELSLHPAPNLLPIRDRKNVLQLKLQQRRTREELVNQGIMPPLKSPAAFHEQRKSLERARTEDYLKRKIRSRPERSELVRMHILEETSAEPSLQAKQLQLKRARLADDLNDKISHRPGPMELIHKNILPVHCSLKEALTETEFPKGAGESSSFDEDSSDALSPDQLASHDSPQGPAPLPSPPHALTCGSNPYPALFIAKAPPPPPPAPPVPSPSQKLTNGTATPPASRPVPMLIKSKSGSDRAAQRSKKAKDSKPKVKKLKYHQYIPPDQKAEREPPPQLDSTYAKILHQQQLFLQLQIINQQQQHYNYHTILPAPPKPPADQQPSSNSGPSPSRTIPAPTSSSPSQSGQSRQSLTLAKPGPLPPNLDELKVAELKQELKARGLPVSGTKNDLIEKLRNFQEQNGVATATGPTPGGRAPKNNPPSQQHQLAQPAGSSPILGGATLLRQSGERGMVLAAFPFVATVGGGGAQTAGPLPVMHFGSTSSSPPASPALSDRSLAGMSPDEISCNGDAFGEMVTSPLTQLSLHPYSQPPVATVKEEGTDSASAACRFSQHAVRPVGGALDKDQMLQEKDKQIEALMRMLRQKQQLVETLRLQLEQGKGPDCVRVKEEPRDGPGDPSACCLRRPCTPELLDGDAIMVTIKQEEEEEEAQEPDVRMQREDQPPDGAQLSQAQQTAQSEQLKLQQRQAELQPQLQQLQQLQNLQNLLVQQSQQRQSEPQQHKKKKSHKQQQRQEVQLQRQEAQLQKQEVQLQKQEAPLHKQEAQLQRQEAPLQKQEAQLQKQEAQLQKQEAQQQLLHSQQVFINQQSPASVSAPSFPLDLLKAQTTPTLVTDSNGNHFLIALTNHCADGGAGRSAEGRVSRRVKLQRFKSTPTKVSSQSPPHPTSAASQSEQRMQPGGLADQPIRKGQRAGLHVSTNSSQGAVLSFSAPPSLQPFFLGDDPTPRWKPAPLLPPLMRRRCVQALTSTRCSAPPPRLLNRHSPLNLGRRMARVSTWTTCLTSSFRVERSPPATKPTRTPPFRASAPTPRPLHPPIPPISPRPHPATTRLPSSLWEESLSRRPPRNVTAALQEVAVWRTSWRAPLGSRFWGRSPVGP